MSIQAITTEDLRRMDGREALILQGCGGELQEWVDGINGILTEEGILLNGTRFSDCYSFEHEERTCLVFPFSDEVELNVGKLAMWRLSTHSIFGGTWLSDFVPNELGGFVQDSPAPKEKPGCPLIGQDGNIFHLLGLASRTLRENGMAGEAKEMAGRVYESGSYYEALGIIGEYVNITGPEEDMEENEDLQMG